MLRAIKDSAKNQEKNTAKIKYTQLVEMFNFVPELENLLRKNCNYFRSI